MKKMLVLSAVLVMLLVGTTHATVYYLADHMANADFDDPWTITGGVADRWGGWVSSHEIFGITYNSWLGDYYTVLCSDATVGRESHSGTAYMVICRNNFPGVTAISQAPSVALEVGSTYGFSIQVRASGLTNVTAVSAGQPLVVVVKVGSTFYPVASFDVSDAMNYFTWTQIDVAFTWDVEAVTAAAGQWSIGIGVSLPAGRGTLDGFDVDSIGRFIGAWGPNPKDGEYSVAQEAVLAWNPPAPSDMASATYDVYLLKDPNPSDPNIPDLGAAVANGITGTNYNPNPDMDRSSTYYWRVDTHGLIRDPNDPNDPTLDYPVVVTGKVWTFSTAGEASDPSPADEAIAVNPTVTLSWSGLVGGYKHDVYFGTDSDDVLNATITNDPSGVYQGRQDVAATTFDPFGASPMAWSTTYYWRIDEVDESTNPDTIIPGFVWSFTTIVPQCTTPPMGDTNNDCVITLEDLANWAADWLKCGLTPVEACP